MITTVATLSLSQAHKRLSFGWGDHPFASMRRAWVGFDTSSADASPLYRVFDGASLVERCVDWDVDGRHAEYVGVMECVSAPSLEIARRIVAFVLYLHRAPAEYALCVHCHAGLFRSGAVAEWVRTDLGVAEHESSNRLVDVIGDTAEQRTFNLALLRMLRAAHTELAR